MQNHESKNHESKTDLKDTKISEVHSPAKHEEDEPEKDQKSPDHSPEKIAKEQAIKKEKEELEKKNQELDKTMQKLVSQNEKLSKEIKDLREQIMAAMEKNKKKGKGSKPEKEDPAISSKINRTFLLIDLGELKAKIENQAKEILTSQKELAVLQEKTDGKKTKDRITDLENNLKFKEAELEKLNSDKKTLEEIRKSHQNIIESIKSEKDYNKKMSIYQEEIRKLRDEIRDQQKKEMDYEKEQRKQHEYLTVLEQRYREICKKNGISASLNFTRAEKQNEEVRKSVVESKTNLEGKPDLKKKKEEPKTTAKGKDNQKLPSNNPKGLKSEKNLLKNKETKSDDEEDQLPKEINEENYKILLEKYQEIQNLRQTNLRKFKQEEDTYAVKVKELELERRVLANKFKEKESEANIAIVKLNELKRISKQTSSLSTPFDVLDKSMLRNGVDYNVSTKKSLIKTILDTRKRKTKREVVGDTSSDPADILILEDGELIADYLTMDFSIVEISVYHDGKNKIYGFKATYLIDGEKVEGHFNVLKQVKSLPTTKVTVLKIEKPNDSLKFISGFSLDFIEYIKFETVKGDSIVVGNLSREKARELKEFCIEVKKDDLVTVLFGGLKFNPASNNANDMLLSFFGIETLNNNIYQKWLNRKKAPREEIEESILVEEDNSILLRRGLVLGKRIPMKKY